MTFRTYRQRYRHLLSGMLAFAILPMISSTVPAKTIRLQAGTLECEGKGGWGAIITSKKTFECVFITVSGKPLGLYKAVIRKYGIDIGKTGNTSLRWTVLGPARKIGNKYVLGSLQGEYAGVGAEASAGLGLGANALIGGGEDSLALQPISVQAQSGVSIAAGVSTLVLTYVGPAS